MKSYCVTGATGYVGSMLIKNIRKLDQKSKIVAFVRDEKKAKKLLPLDVEIRVIDLSNRQVMLQVNDNYDYIIHCASITKSAEMISHPVEVIESIVNTTQNVLELARICKAKSIVFVSSMEVYGNIDCTDGHRVSEDEMGFVDLLNIRSCYPIGKRMAENICYSYYKEHGIPVKIARLAQTFGYGILPTDNRVFVQFAKAAKNKTDIVLHTKGDSMGNYCDISDAIKGLLLILENGVNGEAYNVVNEKNTMTIKQMAELVAQKIAGGNIKVVYDIPENNNYGYAATTGLRLSGKKLMDLGWKPTKTLEEMYEDINHIPQQEL